MLRDKATGRFFAFPKAGDIVGGVIAYRDELQSYDPKDIADEEGNPCGDIRLQVLYNGSWRIHTGDSSYDTDHRGYWGDGTIQPSDTDAQCLEVARWLVECARENMRLNVWNK